MNKETTHHPDQRVADSILYEAMDNINGPRQRDYGTAYSNFTSTAELWSIYLNKHITAENVGMCMILLKTSRLMNKNITTDSLIDIAGYAALTAEIAHENDKDD